MTDESAGSLLSAPPIGGILETSIYVDDLDRASAFYTRLLGAEAMVKQERLHAFAIAPGEVLLVFPRAVCVHDSKTKFGVIPGHRSDGPGHFAFRIPSGAMPRWRNWLERLSIPVISEVNWPQGGQSLFFNDPDGNVLEVATPGLWPNYRDW